MVKQSNGANLGFESKHGISTDKIKVAIGYVGLRSTINTGKIDAELDERQPRKTAFETFSKKVNVMLEWKRNTDKFFEAIITEENDEQLWRAIVEQYRKEALNRKQEVEIVMVSRSG